MGNGISRIALVVGGAIVSALGPEFVPEQYRWPLVIGGVALIIVGVTLPWLSALIAKIRAKPRPQLYLYTAPLGEEPRRWDGYFASWCPSMDFGIAFSNHAPSQIASKQELPPKEKAVTLHLFNAGPEDVRHIKIRWSIPSFDVVDAVKKHGLFGGYVSKLSNSHIQLASPTSAAERPLRNPDEVIVPLLKAHEAMVVKSPEPFTGLLAVACLAIAKEIDGTPPLPKEEAEAMNPLDTIARFERDMPNVKIALEYEVDGRVARQAFSLEGTAIKCGLVQKVDGENGEYYDQVPDSLCGGIMSLQVIPQ